MKERILPELLAPAGNFEKLRAAYYFGADAAYAGGKNFSLRASADNFTDEELARAAEYARSLGKKLYVAVNIFAKEDDLAAAAEYFRFLARIGIDAAIVSDPGLVALARETAPELPLHLSTQANTLNSAAVRFWAEQGVKRVVLARELSVGEAARIARAAGETELETFVHGAMCVSYSGRCLLSNYLNGRDANRGECVQACRWKYSLREAGSGGEWLDIAEDGRGSYILNSRDLNMIRRIGELADAGVRSFKIEGRMKSVYYVATVVNAYRRALDEWAARGEAYRDNPLYPKELSETAHRSYTEAYADGANDRTLSPENAQTEGASDFIALVVRGTEGGFAEIEMRGRFRAGDTLSVLSPSPAFGREIVAEEMYGEGGERVTDAKLVQQRLRLKTDAPLAAGDILRRRRVKID